MKIKLFATLKDRARASEISVPASSALTVRELRSLVASQFPALAALMPQTLVAVNQQFAFNEDTVLDTDEVALFPPVSGGAPEQNGEPLPQPLPDTGRGAGPLPRTSQDGEPRGEVGSAPPLLQERGPGSEVREYPTLLRITPDPIDLNELQRAITTEYDGAVVIFTGTVRKFSSGEVTLQLEYEAYTEMALAKLRQVAIEMREKFAAIHGVALVQRTGPMQVCEPTVAVLVGAGHRGDGAFEAARYGIDRLKQVVPVWKRETRPDGSAWVEGDYVPVKGD